MTGLPHAHRAALTLQLRAIIIMIRTLGSIA